MKIGIILGSFSPIHIGHLYMASSALNEGLVDKVIFVPSVQNPWKETSISFEHRLSMIQLAIEDLEYCGVSNIDFMTTSPHYSSNTLKLLKEEYPNDKLCLLVGTDVFNQIRDWHEGNWILGNFKLIEIGRDSDAYLGTVSSTIIRELAKNGKYLYPLVPKVVEEYIKRNKLYE